MKGNTIMAKAASKTKKSSKQDHPQVQRILETAGETRPNVQAFVDWIVSLGGPEMDLEHTQIVISSYKHFQKSDAAVAYREEVAGSREAQEAERNRVRDEKRAERDAKAAAEKAAKSKKASTATKSTKGKKSAAAESVPAAKATKGKTAKKAAPAKKKSSTKKAAF